MNANGWHYAQGEKTFGPVDLKELQVILSRTSDPRNLLVWKVGFKGWERAGNVPELAQLIDKPPPLPKTPEPPPLPQTSQPRKSNLWRAARYAIIIILAIFAGFGAGIIKELFPALHDVPTQVIVILTAFVVGIIILLFQRARGTLHDDHWAKDQFKNKAPVVSPAEPPRKIHEPVVSDDNVGKEVKPPLSGIAGWLILIAIGQVVGVIKLLASLAKYYGDADPKLFQQFPVTVWGEALLNIGLVGLMIYTAVLFFQKSRKFPQFFIYEWIFVIFMPLIDMVWVALTLSFYTGRPFAEFAELDPQTVGETIAAIIGAAVWITYIKKSRRVANTFTK